GGSSNLTEVTEEEYSIVERVNPVLQTLGIVMYGLDTLVDDDGKRVLSEINTTSIGGIAQIAAMRQLPLLEKTVELICQFVFDQMHKT
ncbi:MAG: glutathione synthetase, partial [Bacteroidota bacterium]